MDAYSKLPEGSAESVSSDGENLRIEEGSSSFLRNGEFQGEGEDNRREGTFRLSEEKERKITEASEVSLVWCVRCDTNLIWVHSSYYCPNCKMKFGCCGE